MYPLADVPTPGHGKGVGVRRRQVPRSGTQDTMEGAGRSEDGAPANLPICGVFEATGVPQGGI